MPYFEAELLRCSVGGRGLAVAWPLWVLGVRVRPPHFWPWWLVSLVAWVPGLAGGAIISWASGSWVCPAALCALTGSLWAAVSYSDVVVRDSERLENRTWESYAAG